MENMSGSVWALAIIFLVLSMIAISLRIYVRAFMIKSLGRDDYTMIASQAAFLAYLACQIGGVKHGTGRHIEDLDVHEAQKALKYWYFCEIFYSPATTLLKVSVGFFLLRIAAQKLQIWVIRIFIGGSIFFGVLYELLCIFQCHPVSFWWDLSPDATGTCIDPKIFSILAYFISALNSMADLAFAILPMFIVYGTTMTRKQRFLVCLLLGIGSIAGIATIVRIPYLDSLNHYKGDFLWNTTQVAMLTTLELGLGIVAGCAATLRPLIQAAAGKNPSSAGSAMRSKSRKSIKLNLVPEEKEPRSPQRSIIQKTTTYVVTARLDEGDRGHGLRSESEESLNGRNGSHVYAGRDRLSGSAV